MAAIKNTYLFNQAGLVSYYDFDTGSLTADSKGANTLTNNSSVTSTSSGKYGLAASFGAPNTSAYLSKASTLGLGTGPFSFALWANLQTAGTSGAFVNFSDVASNVFTRFTTTNGTQVSFFRVKNGIIQQGVLSTYTTPINQFVHYGMTYDGTNVVGYINGTSQGTQPASGTGSTTIASNFYISQDMQGGGYFPGVLDDIGVFNYALAGSDMQLLYLEGNGLISSDI